MPRTTGDTVEDPFTLPAIPCEVAGTTEGFNDDYNFDCPFEGSVAPDVVYEVFLDAGAALDLDLCGSGYDTKIYIMDSSLEVIECNDDAYYSGDICGVYVSRLTTSYLYPGQYYIVIDGFGDEAGPYSLSVESIPPPTDPLPDYSEYWWAFEEGEPPNKPGYEDFYNPGCNWDCNHFTWVDLLEGGKAVRGSAGWSGGNWRDTDWYELFVSFSELNFKLQAARPTRIYRVDLSNPDYPVIIDSALATPENPALLHAEYDTYGALDIIVIAPEYYGPSDPYTFDYPYLLEFTRMGGGYNVHVPPTIDKAFGCPTIPPGGWFISVGLNHFENDFDMVDLGCTGSPTPGGDATLDFFMSPGDRIQGEFLYSYREDRIPDEGREPPQCAIVDDMRLGSDNCLLVSSGFYNDYYSFTAEVPGLYSFVVDSDLTPCPGFWWSVYFNGVSPTPPANNTCDGAIPLPVLQFELQDDLTYARNNFDTGFACASPPHPGATIPGNTSRDIVYHVWLLPGQELDVLMEGVGDWDELLYLVEDCEDPVGSCLAISRPEGSGTRLQYTSNSNQILWLVCDSWGVGYREFHLSGFNGFTQDRDPLRIPASSSAMGLEAHPNPFNPRTRFSVHLPVAGTARLEIFDLQGRRIVVLADGNLEAGDHQFTWSGLDSGGRTAPAGVYLARLVANGKEEVRRVMLLK